MTATARLETALVRLLPEGAEVDGVVPGIAMPMHMGLDGRAVSLRQGTLFAKAFHADALYPYSFSSALAGAERAGAAGIGPKVVASDPAAEVILFEHLGADWRAALAPDLQKGPLREGVVAAMRGWHGQPALDFAISPFDVIAALSERLVPRLDKGTLIYKGEIPLASIQAWIGRIEQALSASGIDTCPVRGENVASNVMIGQGNRIMLVDFDRAAMADPWWDLGALSLDICRTEDERAELVELYAGRADPALLARMKLYAIVDDYVWACWALLADEGAETQGPELYKYANNRLVRLVHHLGRFDLGALLQKV